MRSVEPVPPTPSADLAVAWDAALPDLGALVELLVSRGLTVAVAESLTGGAVVDALVGVPGVSACLRGGVVAYATDVKEAVLGVDGRLIAAHGAVHPQVAVEMADGVRRLLTADLGVATTGVAGPDPQDGQAPGTVHVAVVGGPGTLVASRRPDGRGDRTALRVEARDAALRLLATYAGREQVAGRPR